MSLQISAWIRVGKALQNLLDNPSGSPYNEAWQETISLAYRKNAWFKPSQIEFALKGIVRLLEESALTEWAAKYTPVGGDRSKSIGVIMAGNIPMAGFHDLLCVSLSGHTLNAKLSSDDQVLQPFIHSILKEIDAGTASKIRFDGNIKDAGAVIATGSNNSSRYFEYYFGSKPHIFRKNRNSAAILTGEENEYDLILLGRDIFTYFGLGCRNVSKLYVPEDYSFDAFFTAMQSYSEVMDHNKYMNNYDYNKAVYLLNNQPFLTNNFMILMESTQLASPVSAVFYERYRDEDELRQTLDALSGEIQCIAGKKGPVLFGQTQMPAVSDYADGVDTMAFLTGI